jgi:non-lysosomal glucosylceramidase
MDGTLAAWQGYPASQNQDSHTGSYHALYPRSWFIYENVFQAKLTCEQFSPIWPQNYQETSYPAAVFLWTVSNPSDRPITLSILLTWQNMVGWFTNSLKSPDVKLRDDGSPVYDYQPRLGESTGNVNRLINQFGNPGLRVGVVMERENTGKGRNSQEVVDSTFNQSSNSSPPEGIGQWAIATNCPPNAGFFYHTRWNPAGNGAEIWQSFARDGSLPNIINPRPASAGEQIGAAIAVRFVLPPGESLQIPFVVSWDFPVTEFAQGVEYFRRYTDFFGRDGQNAWAIAQTALDHYAQWQQAIQAWQTPILQRTDLPDWFKMALFNELYDLTDGGTLWSAASDRDPFGQFAVLECLDYRWYESLDVRLYGSFALLMLFPELEKSVIRAFARAIPTSDDRARVIGYYHTIGAESLLAPRKIAAATPHDLGAPNEHVWEKTNYTSYQDCNLWKDLPCDFVLQVYRAFLFTDVTDIGFLQECWGAIVQTLHYLKSFDKNFDGIPENSGAPDQTFDDWKLQGISAYCGGLWLAALQAAIAIGRTLAENATDIRLLTSISQEIGNFHLWLEQSQGLYQDKLWNGQYYRLDSESNSDVVMADQLCGQFYARLLKLPDIVPSDCTRTALRTIYDACFTKFNANFQLTPAIGVANGVRPDGSPENPNSTHPLEVWTGINFGLAAFLVQMGMKDEALQITQAVVEQIYSNGLQFRTPEAITPVGTFRASHYLRPMAIWALYGVLSGSF